MNRRENCELIESLIKSKIFQDYERAFSEATGLPVSLRPVESWQLPHHGKRHENPLCAMMAEKSRACAACLQIQQQLSESARFEPATVTCHLGLVDTAVPVRLGERLIGFLQTGQVLRKKPTAAQISRTAALVAEWGIGKSATSVWRRFTGRPKCSVGQTIRCHGQAAWHFCRAHLAGQQPDCRPARGMHEPPAIAKAREFIAENQAEDLSLGQVAKAVNIQHVPLLQNVQEGRPG